MKNRLRETNFTFVYSDVFIAVMIQTVYLHLGAICPDNNGGNFLRNVDKYELHHIAI